MLNKHVYAMYAIYALYIYVCNVYDVDAIYVKYSGF